MRGWDAAELVFMLLSGLFYYLPAYLIAKAGDLYSYLDTTEI